MPGINRQRFKESLELYNIFIPDDMVLPDDFDDGADLIAKISNPNRDPVIDVAVNSLRTLASNGMFDTILSECLVFVTEELPLEAIPSDYLEPEPVQLPEPKGKENEVDIDPTPPATASTSNLSIIPNTPEELIQLLTCPITQTELQNKNVALTAEDTFKDPVTTPQGHTYERANIVNYLEEHNGKAPNDEQLTANDLYPNLAIKIIADQVSKTGKMNEDELEDPYSHDIYSGTIGLSPDGRSMDYGKLIEWVTTNPTCPFTRAPCTSEQVRRNLLLERLTQFYQSQPTSSHVEANPAENTLSAPAATTNNIAPEIIIARDAANRIRNLHNRIPTRTKAQTEIRGIFQDLYETLEVLTNTTTVLATQMTSTRRIAKTLQLLPNLYENEELRKILVNSGVTDYQLAFTLQQSFVSLPVLLDAKSALLNNGEPPNIEPDATRTERYKEKCKDFLENVTLRLDEVDPASSTIFSKKLPYDVSKDVDYIKVTSTPNKNVHICLKQNPNPSIVNAMNKLALMLQLSLQKTETGFIFSTSIASDYAKLMVCLSKLGLIVNQDYSKLQISYETKQYWLKSSVLEEWHTYIKNNRLLQSLDVSSMPDEPNSSRGSTPNPVKRPAQGQNSAASSSSTLFSGASASTQPKEKERAEGETNWFSTMFTSLKTTKKDKPGVLKPLANQMKILVVGDRAVGKTCLIYSYVRGRFPSESDGLEYKNSSARVMIDGNTIYLDIWDLAGQGDYDRLRALSYPKTDVFMLCYSPYNPNSFNNITETWIKELRHHCPDVPIVLVATKSDLKDDLDTIGRLADSGLRLISPDEGRAKARSIGASAYLECSARTRVGLEIAFAQAARATTQPIPEPEEKSLVHKDNGRR